MLGSLLMGGLSALGSLFGGSGKRKSEKDLQRRRDAATKAYNAEQVRITDKMNREVRARADRAASKPISVTTVGDGNLAGLVADAERNGFNPLTVLRAGGQGLYARSTQRTYGSEAMNAALAGQHMPQMAMAEQGYITSNAEVMGGAVNAGLGAMSQQLQQEWQNAAALDLVNAQLAGAQRQGAYQGSRSFFTPSATLAGGVTSASGNGALAIAGAFGRGAGTSSSNWTKAFSALPESRLNKQMPQSQVGGEYCFGFCWALDPTVSAGQAVEDVLAEPGSWAHALPAIGAHIAYNITGQTMRDRLANWYNAPSAKSGPDVFASAYKAIADYADYAKRQWMEYDARKVLNTDPFSGNYKLGW